MDMASGHPVIKRVCHFREIWSYIRGKGLDEIEKRTLKARGDVENQNNCDLEIRRKFGQIM